MYEVICSDGIKRHMAPFASELDAIVWTKDWHKPYHRCSRTHITQELQHPSIFEDTRSAEEYDGDPLQQDDSNRDRIWRDQ